jgi:hypothetical protein
MPLSACGVLTPFVFLLLFSEYQLLFTWRDPNIVKVEPLTQSHVLAQSFMNGVAWMETDFLRNWHGLEGVV